MKAAGLDLIRSVPITEANCRLTIQHLKQWYENKSLVTQWHIRAILETASAKELEVLHSHISTHITALNAIDHPVVKRDPWLVTIILGWLNRLIAHDWQLRQII